MGETKYRGWSSKQLANEYIRVDVTPELGGRILNYQLGSHSFLWSNPLLEGNLPPASRLGPGGVWLNWGGDKLWPAPQGWENAEQWPGPPDPVLDGGPHQVKALPTEVGSAAMELTSLKDERTGIQFKRVIRIFDHSSRVQVAATMTNIDIHPRRWGIWSVTQLDAGNRTGAGWNPEFHTYVPINKKSHFPGGYRVLYGKPTNPEIQLNGADDMLHVHYQWIVGKVGLDSDKGWLASVDGSRGFVFVQCFDFHPDVEYPDDSSVEVWTNGLGTIHAWGCSQPMPVDPSENPYVVESELLSPLSRLAPGEQSTFDYNWYSANIGGNYPILSCTFYGCVCEPFIARPSGGWVLVSGRFGVFYEGRWALQFLDSEGKVVVESVASALISPLHPLDLAAVPFKAPARTIAVRLVIYASNEEKAEKIADCTISQS